MLQAIADQTDTTTTGDEPNKAPKDKPNKAIKEETDQANKTKPRQPRQPSQQIQANKGADFENESYSALIQKKVNHYTGAEDEAAAAN